MTLRNDKGNEIIAKAKETFVDDSAAESQTARHNRSPETSRSVTLYWSQHSPAHLLNGQTHTVKSVCSISCCFQKLFLFFSFPYLFVFSPSSVQFKTFMVFEALLCRLRSGLKYVI